MSESIIEYYILYKECMNAVLKIQLDLMVQKSNWPVAQWHRYSNDRRWHPIPWRTVLFGKQRAYPHYMSMFWNFVKSHRATLRRWIANTHPDGMRSSYHRAMWPKVNFAGFVFIKNVCRFCANWKLIFNCTNLACRTTTLNGIHDKRLRSCECLWSCCHRTQSIRFEQFKCSRPICHIWRKQVIANDAMILMSSLNWLVYFSVELPNYSTESTDEESYEQSYYDDSSSSAMDPQSTIDGTSYDSYPFDPYNRSSSTNSEKYILLFTIFGLFLFNWQ